MHEEVTTYSTMSPLQVYAEFTQMFQFKVVGHIDYVNVKSWQSISLWLPSYPLLSPFLFSLLPHPSLILGRKGRVGSERRGEERGGEERGRVGGEKRGEEEGEGEGKRGLDSLSKLFRCMGLYPFESY